MATTQSGPIIPPRFITIDGMVNYVMKELDRDSSEAILKTEKTKLLPKEFVQLYQHYYANEINHINHVRSCMDYLLGLGDPALDRIPHDYSKNERYLFLTICAFNLKEYCNIDP